MDTPNRESPSQPLSYDRSNTHLEDEISLVDLWQILKRRKYWIVGCVFGCLTLGVLYVSLKSPVFEATTKIRIGQVADVGVIEDSAILTTTLMVTYGRHLADGIMRDLPFLKSATVQKNSKDLVELTVAGQTPAQAATHLKKIWDDIIRNHETMWENGTQILKERIQMLQEQKKALQTGLDNATEILETLKERDPVQASLTILERGRISADLYRHDAELHLLYRKLSPPQTIPTVPLGEIIAPEAPATPNKRLIVSFAIILGLFSGIMIAFFVEFVSKINAEK
jgi:uncharacterized protein involved in exopolysaccharide biosynthesis